MGAWGSGPFDNDDAMDFVGDLQDMPTASQQARIRDALALEDGYVESPAANEALAAAALIVAAIDDPPLEPHEVAQLVAGGGVPTTDADREAATTAMSRVLDEDSEWRELWTESGSLDEARAVCARLAARLED